MKRKMFLCLFLALCIFLLSACGGNDVPDGTDDDGTPKAEQSGNSNNETDKKGETETDKGGNEEPPVPAEAEVYANYPNLRKIYGFYNGLAAFTVGNNDEMTYGFINPKGDVVIDAMIPVQFKGYNIDTSSIHNFVYQCLKAEKRYTDDKEYIIDRNGKVLYEVGKNNVSAIGTISQGYFWVETLVEETLSGNVYDVVYYSAKTLEAVATFKDTRAFVGSYLNSAKYKNHNSELNAEGYAVLIQNYNAKKEYIEFNIADYDDAYEPPIEWAVDLKNIPDFAGASWIVESVSENNNTAGQLASVTITSKDRVEFYSVVDSKGNVLMKPQKNIQFKEGDVFCQDLCPAYDAESELWGYIDPYGKWVIEPQYSSADSFGTDGYATVNERVVIDKKNNVVLAPADWSNNANLVLSGKYVHSQSSSYFVIFSEDGTFECDFEKGKYEIKGDRLIITDMGKLYIFPTIKGDGSYSFSMKDNTIYIDGSAWNLVE